MSTKRVLAILVIFWGAGLFALAAVPAKTTKPAKSKPAAAAEPAPVVIPPVSLEPKPPLYDPAGRRDPFKDLLGGTETKERATSEGPELLIADLQLIGIVKEKGQFVALIIGPQGFPYKIKDGFKFADGYVVKVTADNVTFRQTMERGLRLPTPKEVVKEINPEER